MTETFRSESNPLVMEELHQVFMSRTGADLANSKPQRGLVADGTSIEISPLPPKDISNWNIEYEKYKSRTI